MSEKETLCSWTEWPYTSHDKRTHEVQHRVIVERFDRLTTDIRHEVRSGDNNSVPKTWTLVTAVRNRPDGLSVFDGGEVLP